MTLWQDFIAAMVANKTVPNNLKPAVLAQAALESGRGTTELARNAMNMWALHYRWDIPLPLDPVGHYHFVYGGDNPDYFKFTSLDQAITYYWAFLHRWPYPHVEECKTSEELLTYIGSKFCPPGYAAWWINTHQYLNYHEYIIRLLLPEAKIALIEEGWKMEEPIPVVVSPTKYVVERGIVQGIPFIVSPNTSSRGNCTIDTIVMHYTASMGGIKGVASWFANPRSGVSAHFVVGRDGSVIQSVNLNLASWHAGVWTYNQRSIGIEMENYGWMDHAWLGRCWRGKDVIHTVPQDQCLYAVGTASPQKLWWQKYNDKEQQYAVHDLVVALKAEYPTLKRIVGHSDVLITKADPGPAWNDIWKWRDL